jgi:hypothetical protein
MALVSPGVQVTVIDESQYIPSAVNTVPYFLIATAQNKVSGAGVGVAAGTIAANANKTYLITSQRDLTATFGNPFFYSTTTGTPINGYELNEYGLLAAYSSLGISNRAYIQRVDINLTELTASLTRPVGEAANGTYWLDTSTSLWGIQQWNQTTGTFTVITPIVITDTNNVVDYAANDYTPLTSIGSIGDYAVVALPSIHQDDPHVPQYYKNTDNAWVIVGSTEWQQSWGTVTGTNAPSTLTIGANMYINATLVAVSATNTVAGFAGVINTAAIAGVTAAAVGGQLVLYSDSDATGTDSTPGVSIEAGPNLGTALLTALGISAGTYYAPTYFPSYSYGAPRWGSTQQYPAPTGSVWQNMSAANNGINLKFKVWNTALADWVAQNTTIYNSFTAATYALDPSGGGKNIPIGTTIGIVDPNQWLYGPNVTAGLKLCERAAFGQTIVTGTETFTSTQTPFTVGNSFTVQGTAAGSNTLNQGTATIGGTGTVADFVAAVSAADVPYVSATVDSSGAIVFTHSQGGNIILTPVSGTPITIAGFTGDTPFVQPGFININQMVLSNWVDEPQFTYTASTTAPDQNPPNGQMWYYSAAGTGSADIMIMDNGMWMGYQNVTNDARGYNLTGTNATGPIFAATAPTTQTNDAQSALVYGDLWIDTSDLENYPVIYRWQQVSGTDQWVSVDTADQTTQNGILFADARWGASGATNPVSDPIPPVASGSLPLITSNYIDLDAPDPSLYPEGMLLWNTRRSGYNVKEFTTGYFTQANYPEAGAYNPADPTNDANLPEYSYTWVSASGNKADGSMYAGRQAQRHMIVQAMKSGIDTSLGAREDTALFTLIATPAYPELIPNMIALSNERNNTLFVVGDTPMRLPGNGTDLAAWANNNGGLGFPTEDGQIATSNYAATFYPSCTTTNLDGGTVVTAPSHMMVRTIIRSDEVSYPWLAPAGTRRGVVDNATQLGYIDSATGEFQPLSVNQGLRDVLYTNNVNPITFIPGVGITNFGNKTSTATTTALDRINVARLVAFLRGRLEEIGKLYLFEPNDQITRNQITNTINSLMIDLVAKRALYDYLVVCDLSNNTPARIDRNELWVDIAIEPVKAIEFIYIPLRIKNTGAIAAGL